MVIGDLNAEVNLECMKRFCETFDLNSLIKVLTCYMNPKKPSCIDLLLTNRPKSLQSSSALEVGLFDFHKMTLTAIKTTFGKIKPKVSNFKKWNKFCDEKFRAQC